MSNIRETFQKYIPPELRWNLAAIAGLGISGTLGILPEVTNAQEADRQGPVAIITDQEFRQYLPLIFGDSRPIPGPTSAPGDPPTPVPDNPSPTPESPTATPIPPDNLTPTATVTPKPQESPTAISTATSTNTPTATPASVMVKSVESMSQTKDRVCAQPSDAFIAQWTQYAAEAGASHITVAMPYDNDCNADSEAYAKRWTDAARQAGLNIWWRQMFSEFEGIYGATVVPQCNGANENACNDYVKMTKDKIIAQKTLYQSGDVFSFTAEPAASRIRGVNCFNATNGCVFESANGSWNAIPEFNAFLLDGIAAAREAFNQIGLPSIEVNAGGLDLFVAIGYNNPDWDCRGLTALYPETVKAMNGFVFDHYLDTGYQIRHFMRADTVAAAAGNETMTDALDAIGACYPADQYPNLQFDIGEWGPISGSDTPGQIARAFTDVRAADSRFQGKFNYWQGGPAGQESLFTGSGPITVTANYAALQAEYQR